MRFADLPVAASGLPSRVSVLGFGCAPVMGRVGRKASLLALHAAFDAGINFFDTARSYGYGESETLLGEFLRGGRRRDSVVLCTKFGILPAPRGGWKQKVKPLAQAAISAFPQLRGFARRHAADQFLPGQFSVETLRTSLASSLRELRTGYVDMLLLHAAEPAVLDNHDLLEALDRLVRAGTVRMAGISGPHTTILATIEQQPRALTTAQFAMDPDSFGFAAETAKPEARNLLLVANHPFGGANGVEALQLQILLLANDVSLPATLREKLTGAVSELMPEIVFGCILEGTGISAVVAAMMTPSNLRNNVRAIDHCRFTPEELALLRTRLAAA